MSRWHNLNRKDESDSYCLLVVKLKSDKYESGRQPGRPAENSDYFCSEIFLKARLISWLMFWKEGSFSIMRSSMATLTGRLKRFLFNLTASRKSRLRRLRNAAVFIFPDNKTAHLKESEFSHTTVQ